MPGNELVYDVNTGALYLGAENVATGFVTGEMVETRVMDTEAYIMNRVAYLENELNNIKRRFTAEFAKELISLCNKFVSERELTGMTDEEFESALGELLFSGGA